MASLMVAEYGGKQLSLILTVTLTVTLTLTLTLTR